MVADKCFDDWIIHLSWQLCSSLFFLVHFRLILYPFTITVHLQMSKYVDKSKFFKVCCTVVCFLLHFCFTVCFANSAYFPNLYKYERNTVYSASVVVVVVCVVYINMCVLYIVSLAATDHGFSLCSCCGNNCINHITVCFNCVFVTVSRWIIKLNTLMLISCLLKANLEKWSDARNLKMVFEVMST